MNHEQSCSCRVLPEALCYTRKLYAIPESPMLLYQKVLCYTRKYQKALCYTRKYQKALCYTREPYDLAVLVQIYAVALFVEAEPAAHELGIRHRGGFFQDNRCCVLYILRALQP
jgi:hypothetical protein